MKRLTDSEKEKRKQIEDATALVKSIEKRMRAKSFKDLSQYSKQLIKKQYSDAVEKQMDLIFGIIENKK